MSKEKTKIAIIIFLMTFIPFVILADERKQEIIGFGPEQVEILKSNLNKLRIENSTLPKVFLTKAVGKLQITITPSTETYEAYFHIPIPFQEQVPILIEVESPQLIDYRFVHLNSPNVIIAARMKKASYATLNWTAWVLVKENKYSDLPSYSAIPTLEQLPEYAKKWLAPTDCAQLSAPIVQAAAKIARSDTTNLMELAKQICSHCYGIPWNFPHQPVGFDAVYALTWGNSCTGHAHAGAALFRANGIPARSLLNIPVSGQSCDMHWIIDYYVPDYGWVRMETSTGINPIYPQYEIVTFASNPEDEFCLFFPCAIDGCWHTSDPSLGMWNPDWGRAHSATSWNFISDTQEKIKMAHSLTNSVFFYYSRYWGIEFTPAQQTLFQNAYSCQASALEDLKSGNLDSFIGKMREALNNYINVNADPITTIFFDDFEAGENNELSWSHGGSQDEWELGTPTYGPEHAHSGTKCWATDLDDTYENNADNWLMSPLIDLTKQKCAYLSFWVWNSVQDEYGFVYDPLWLDITTDGTTFSPLCSEMGGINDDPEIPGVGGWSRVVLDLTKYVGSTVQIRFRFQSAGFIVQPGSYIDDVHCYGRSPKDSLQHYTLNLSTEPGGTIDLTPGVHIYDEGKEITIEAFPEVDYKFSHWTGDVFPENQGNNPISFTIDANKSIEAHFIRQYTLTIAAGTGGTTSPSPGTYTYDSGTNVSIQAYPKGPYRFSGWSGDASGTTNQITITMDRNKSVTANFIRQYVLIIATGTGGMTDPPPGGYYFGTGTQVTVTAIPYNGYQFSYWSRDASGTTNPITITIDRDKSVQANFFAISQPSKEKEKGGCFIATAAYGSPFHPYVEMLREFRDKYLMPNKFGRSLVDFYYKYSPLVADLITKHKILKIITRISLLPLVAFSYSTTHLGLLVTAIMLIFISGISISGTHYLLIFIARKILIKQFYKCHRLN